MFYFPTDLLSLGPLKESLHMTFNISPAWLWEQYKLSNLENSKIDVWYDKPYLDVRRYDENAIYFTTLNMFNIILPPSMNDHYKPSHHSRMSLFYYRDDNTSKEFIRVAVMTANLTYDEWNTHNQGIWISPKCELLSTAHMAAIHVAYGESTTKFKATLLAYLQHYSNDHRNPDIDESLNRWVQHVKRANFEHIRVVLIASAPGIYKTEPVMPENCYPSSKDPDNMRIVQEYFCNSHNIITKTLRGDGISSINWPIIAQTSKIGKFGPEDVIFEELLPSLSTTRCVQAKPNLWIIYPSAEDYQQRELPNDLGGLFYYSTQHQQQLWIEQHLLRWSAERTGRTKIMPLIKSYCRVSPNSKLLSWFLLTSACLTKNAWGCPYSQDNTRRAVGNYEMGVLFLPIYFGDNYFAIQDVNENGRAFPFMYDLNLYGIPHFRDRCFWDKDYIKSVHTYIPN
ncbi:Tyrosyl-DNA phosphodiesterase [Popillia japonica]|uniref:Tyrosyl-DNA phosphodiesterase n=1 Tax=Popillia japonica TaxID=7064 RepID=A0AAW1IVV1_POPJA